MCCLESPSYPYSFFHISINISFSYPFSFLKFPNFPQFSLTLYVIANHLSASTFRKFSDHCLKIGSVTWSINAMNRKNTFKWINMVPSERNLYQKIKNIQNNGFCFGITSFLSLSVFMPVKHSFKFILQSCRKCKLEC